MSIPALGPISPCFIVTDVPAAISFYQRQLGFEVRYSEPAEQPFFAIVGRDSAQIFLKSVSDVSTAKPNRTRHEWVPWDAFVYVGDPDSLAAEFESSILSPKFVEQVRTGGGPPGPRPTHSSAPVVSALESRTRGFGGGEGARPTAEICGELHGQNTNRLLKKPSHIRKPQAWAPTPHGRSIT